MGGLYNIVEDVGGEKEWRRKGRRGGLYSRGGSLSPVNHPEQAKEAAFTAREYRVDANGEWLG